MRKLMFPLFVMVLLLFMLFPQSVFGYVEGVEVVDGLMDSAWPMKGHRHTSLSTYSTKSHYGEIKWKFGVVNGIDAGIVLDRDDTSYFGPWNYYLYAVYSNGSLKWNYKTNGIIWSTPTLAQDGTIYVTSYDAKIHVLYPNGTLRWKFSAGGSITSSPAIDKDGIIYFDVMGPGYKGRVYALYPNGTVKWYYDTNYYIASGPALGEDENIYIDSRDTYFYAFYSNGTLKWRFGPPSIAEDGTIYIGSHDDYLYALYPDGRLKWKCKVGRGTETNPSIGPDGTIYVGDSRLYAVSSDGVLKWTLDLGSGRHIHMSTPAVSSDGIIYVGTNVCETSGGEIADVNPDGSIRCRRMITNDWVDSSPCIGTDGVIYIGSSSTDKNGSSYSYLYAFGSGSAPPDKPSISDPGISRVGETYGYTFTAVDGNLDDIYYYIDQGDNTSTDWPGHYRPGESINVTHSWSEKGAYIIKAKIKDIYGLESTRWINGKGSS